MSAWGRRTAGGLAVLAVVVAAAVAPAAPARADDLGDYLDRAGAAQYGGTRIVMTLWGDQSFARVEEVEHSRGTTMILGPDGDTVMGGGRTAVADGGGVALSEWDGTDVSDRYTVDEAVPVRRSGRPAIQVTVRQEGKPRVRLVLDEETSAPLSTEVLDGEGDLFRYATFTDFDPHPRKVHTSQSHDAGYEVVVRADEAATPLEVAGYTRVDVYEDGEGVRQAFYSDGLFGFSVFATPEGAGKIDFEGAEPFEAGDRSYLLIVEPSEMWVRWDAGGGGYALVGNLPPDHLVDVLAALPAPDDGGLWDRLWRSFFG